MKQPKRLNPKKTAIFLQTANDRWIITCCPRLRLLHPDGKSQWIALNRSEDSMFSKWSKPCWHDGRQIKNRKDALKEMRKFDKEGKWKPAVFIGYLEDWGGRK